MQKLNFKQLQNLNNALNSTEVVEISGQLINKSVLKSGKDLSGDNYLKVASVKKKLRNAIEEVAEKEKPLFEDYDAQSNGQTWQIKAESDSPEDIRKANTAAKELSNKLNTLHESIEVEIPEPFIPKNEFLQWTKECNTEVASILAEFLLDGFEK